MQRKVPWHHFLCSACLIRRCICSMERLGYRHSNRRKFWTLKINYLPWYQGISRVLIFLPYQKPISSAPLQSGVWSNSQFHVLLVCLSENHVSPRYFYIQVNHLCQSSDLQTRPSLEWHETLHWVQHQFRMWQFSGTENVYRHNECLREPERNKGEFVLCVLIVG